jgi:hypothetical protein
MKHITLVFVAVLSLGIIIPAASATNFPLEVVTPQVHTETKQEVLEYFVYGDGGYWSYADCKTTTRLPAGISRKCRYESEIPSFVTGIELYKNQKRYAFYDNVLDAKFSANGRFLAMWNAVKKPSGEYIEQKKIIDVVSKKTTLLPMEDCTARIASFGTYLVTVANEPQADSGVVPLPPSICIWNTSGKLIARVQAKGLATATDDRKLALYVLGQFDNAPEEESEEFTGFCQLAVIDINSQKTVFKQFSTKYWHYNCFTEVEVDLSKFTFASPTLRFREKENASATWTDWKSAQLENVQN